MPQKIAVAIIHGVGRQGPNFADKMKKELKERYAKARNIPVAQAENEIVFQTVYWAPVLEDKEKTLWEKVQQGGPLDFISLRKFMVSFVADAMAYQPLPYEQSVYEDVHTVFAQKLKALADPATGAGPDAPLCVIAHSLGTVIVSNYLYDLHTTLKPGSTKNLIPAKVDALKGDTPLENGETLAFFVTMGNPIALWSLRYKNPQFGIPIQVPTPLIQQRYPGLGGWKNFYDEDDIIAYPLKQLNPKYQSANLEDLEVNSGGLFSSWNPLSHNGYWTDDDVTKPVTNYLVQMWRAANPAANPSG